MNDNNTRKIQNSENIGNSAITLDHKSMVIVDNCTVKVGNNASFIQQNIQQNTFKNTEKIKDSQVNQSENSNIQTNDKKTNFLSKNKIKIFWFLLALGLIATSTYLGYFQT